VVAKYYGEARNYSPVIGKHIHWPGGSDGPPEDVPVCGFLGSGPACDSKGNYVIFSNTRIYCNNIDFSQFKYDFISI